MTATVILDTGPWVALHCKDERHHAWSRARFAQHPGPFITCEAVVTVLTLDGDFHVYRRHGRKTIPLLRPD